jgi:hypothetical protein
MTLTAPGHAETIEAPKPNEPEKFIRINGLL